MFFIADKGNKNLLIWQFADLPICNYFVPLQKIKGYYEYHNIKT
jgi:hypothetical protein